MANDNPEPFRITLAGGRYMVYDVKTIEHIQHKHGIEGASQALKQYNPLELKPEDAALLVNKGAAHILNDDAVNKPPKSPQDSLAQNGKPPKIATASDNTQDNWNDIPDDMFASRGRGNKTKRARSRLGVSPSTAPGSSSASVVGDDDGPPRMGLRATASQPLLRPPMPPPRPTYS